RRSDPIVCLSKPKEARPVPFGPGDGPRDTGKAGMAATIPDAPVGDHGHVMGSALPLAHQNGPGPCWHRCRVLPGWVRQRASEQSIEFPCRCFPQAAIATLLPHVGDTQRKKLAAERPRRRLTHLLLPEV